MVIPFIIFPTPESQDILVVGPQKWLESNKSIATFMYERQPNPRVGFASSFSFGRVRGLNFFSRSYHFDRQESGTDRRGGLVTLGLASTRLSPSSLQWAYYLAIRTFLAENGRVDWTLPEAEDLGISQFVTGPGSPGISAVATRWAGTLGGFGSGVSRSDLMHVYDNLADAFARSFGRNRPTTAILVDDSMARDTAYRLTQSLVRERTKFRLWPRRQWIETVLLLRSKSKGSGSILLNVAMGTSGLVEIGLHDLMRLRDPPSERE